MLKNIQNKFSLSGFALFFMTLAIVMSLTVNVKASAAGENAKITTDRSKGICRYPLKRKAYRNVKDRKGCGKPQNPRA